MKKIFTLIAATLMAVGANAQTINLAGLTTSQFTADETEFVASSGSDDNGTYSSFNYVKKDKSNWSSLTLTGKNVAFQYKNSSQKDNFFRLYTNFFMANGKDSRIVISGLTSGTVVTLKAAGKNDTGALFSAVEGATADAGNPTSPVGKQSDPANFTDFKFTATGTSMTLAETSAGYFLASITISGGDQPASADNYVVTSDDANVGANKSISSVDGITLTFSDAAWTVSGGGSKDAKTVDGVAMVGKAATAANNGDPVTFTTTKAGVLSLFFGAAVATNKTINMTEGENGLVGKVVSTGAEIASGEYPTEEIAAYDGIRYTLDANKTYTFKVGGTKWRLAAFKYVGSTGITDVKVVEPSTVKDDAIYNLSGQKVNKNYKGVVIKNGVKTIQK